jgi:hypothetical protein
MGLQVNIQVYMRACVRCVPLFAPIGLISITHLHLAGSTRRYMLFTRSRIVTRCWTHAAKRSLAIRVCISVFAIVLSYLADERVYKFGLMKRRVSGCGMVAVFVRS